MAGFSGGDQAWVKKASHHFSFPAIARNIASRTLVVRSTVELKHRTSLSMTATCTSPPAVSRTIHVLATPP